MRVSRRCCNRERSKKVKLAKQAGALGERETVCIAFVNRRFVMEMMVADNNVTEATKSSKLL